MKAHITSLRAMEILDSRGNPTVRVFAGLDSGVAASASVPSGASTGENEACELRDGDKNRYDGKGTLTAVQNVNELIAPKIMGMDPARQAEIDRMMIELDGTPQQEPPWRKRHPRSFHGSRVPRLWQPDFPSMRIWAARAQSASPCR